jgi:catechol 2,3-dioxygenase-like lactoylglutathione lyase family enzyme
MIKQLAHTCIISSDLAATEAFYCGALGLGKTFEFIKDGALYGFYLNLGNGTFLEVFAEPAEDRPSRIRHLCFEVEDIDRAVAELDAKQVVHTEKKLGADQTWQIWIKDPDGIDIEFHQYTEKSSQLTGAACLVDW